MGEVCVLERGEGGLDGGPQHTPGDHVMAVTSEAQESQHPGTIKENVFKVHTATPASKV